VADDFVPTIEALLAHEKRPDHIVVETSGLALPKPLVKAFDWPDLRARVTVDGVIAVVDGPAVAEGRFADDPAAVQRQRAADDSIEHENPLEEVYEDQLLCADLVVLNKADLLDRRNLRSLSNDIKAAAPRARIVVTEKGRIEPNILLGLAAAAEDDLAQRPSHHDAEGEHDHDDFDTFILDVAAPEDAGAFVERLKSIAADHDVLRMKGFVEIAGRPMRLLVQGVGARFTHHYDRPWRIDEPRASRLVVIGQKGIDRDAITASLTG
jgi:cobalamin biosynthesis protein CobW